MSVSLSQRK